MILALLLPALAQETPAPEPDDLPTIPVPENPVPFDLPTIPVPANPEPFLPPMPGPAAPAPVAPVPAVPVPAVPVPAVPVPAAPVPVPAAPVPVAPAPVPLSPVPVAPAPVPVAPPPQPAPVQSNARVLLAPLQSLDPALVDEAARLTVVLNDSLLARHRMLDMAAVPPFPDYSAAVYVLGCPQGSYSGCALVIGNRAEAEWTIGGVVTQGIGGPNIDLVFIENSAAREVLNFGISLDGSGDAPLVQGVNTIFDKILEGAFDAVDLRVVDTDPMEAAKLKKAQQEVLAASLASLEKERGAVARTELKRTGPDKVSKADLDEYRRGDQVKPWEALNMGQSEYRRYRNSGKTLPDWRRLRRGRLGQLVGRVGLGGGSGPFGQSMDGRYSLDNTLQLATLDQFQYVSNTSHLDVDLEVGFGILPFLDVTGVFSWRNSRFNYFINQETADQPVIINPNDFRSTAISSTALGARAAFVPFMARQLRPALHGGVSFWQGTSWDRQIGGVANLVPMTPMTMLLLQVGPGVEFSAGKQVNLFLRTFADVPIGGNLRTSERVQGIPALQEPAVPESFKTANMGFSIQAGFTARLTLIGSGKSNRGSAFEFEDEGDL